MGSLTPLYLDFASTTPLDPRVLEAMIPFFSNNFANASSKDHTHGAFANSAIEKSREKVARMINAEALEIIFTSGCTEAINIGLVGVFLANKGKGNHIITVSTEHKAVLETCFYLEKIGARLTILEVNSEGQIDIDELRHSIRPETLIVSVMHVNNETGIIHNIDSIGEICRNHNVLFFCDTAQSAGKLTVDVIKSKIDLLCLSSHKFNGPKGIGALYVRNGVKIEPIVFGGDQEKRIRPGTYNTPLIVGLGKACELAQKRIEHDFLIIKKIQTNFETLFINSYTGKPFIKNHARSPYISSIILNDLDAKSFILLNQKTISVSTGSACNSRVEEPSYVIKAMVKDQNIAERVIRLSYDISLKNFHTENLNLLGSYNHPKL